MFKATAALCSHVQAWLFDTHRELFSVPERLCHYRNVRPTVEIYSQKRVGTEKTRFYVVQMFQLLM